MRPEHFLSDCWEALRDHMEEELRCLRAKNDRQQDAEQTAHLRGRIAQLKELLDLEEKVTSQPARVTSGGPKVFDDD